MSIVGNSGSNNSLTGWDYAHVSGAGTFIIATSGPCILHTVNANAAGTLCQVYDAADASSLTAANTVAAIATTVQRSTSTFDVRMNNGIVVYVTGSGSDLTISFGPTLP